jgi:integrase
LGIVCDLYLKRQAEPKQRPKTLAQTKRYLDKAWLPLRSVPVAALTRADVAKRLNEIALVSGPIAANRARAALGAACSWEMRQGLMEANPCIALDKPGTEVRRDRILTDDEIVALWKATEAGDDYSAIIRLLLLTGQRREEVAAMTWVEIDFGKAVWSLSATRTKNGKPHEIALAAPVIALLAARKSRGRAYVFGSRSGPFSGFSKAKAELDARLAEATGQPWAAWVLHDIRRTCVTNMIEIGIAPHVVEAVVNHISGHKAGVAGVYNRAAYRTEKQAALERWAAHVEALVSGQLAGNVVTVGRR